MLEEKQDELAERGRSMEERGLACDEKRLEIEAVQCKVLTEER